MSIGPPIPEIQHFKYWCWKSRVKVKWPWCCTTTCLDNSIELQMVWIHPAVSQIWVSQVWPKCCLIWQVLGPWVAHGASSGFKELSSTRSGPNFCQIWQVFGPWASSYGANGQMTMTVHNYRPRQFHGTSNGENSSRGYRYGFCKSGTAGPPWDSLFQNVTLKIQAQGHGCAQRLRSHSQPSIQLIHFLFMFQINQTIHSCDTAISKFDLENEKSLENHEWGQRLRSYSWPSIQLMHWVESILHAVC